MMAPVSGVLGFEEPAGSLVRAGVNGTEFGQQTLTPCHERFRHGRGSGLEPNDRLGLIDLSGEGVLAGFVQLVENMADHEQGGGRTVIPRCDVGIGVTRAQAVDRVVTGERGVVPDADGGVFAHEAGPLGNHPTVSDAAAAAPIKRRAEGRLPSATGELSEDVVPFPSDPFPKREVVVGQVIMRSPIRTSVGGCVEKSVAKPI